VLKEHGLFVNATRYDVLGDVGNKIPGLTRHPVIINSPERGVDEQIQPLVRKSGPTPFLFFHALVFLFFHALVACEFTGVSGSPESIDVVGDSEQWMAK
jgi:hypothetical protein